MEVPSELGVATGGGNLQYLAPAELARHLDVIKAAGARWVRFDVAWVDVQFGGRTYWAWGRYDRVIDAILAHGMQPIGTIAYTPRWARPADCTWSDKCAPANLDDYADFAAAVAARYAPQGARHWELWNEPNITMWLPAPDPERYALLLALAYPRIKEANPDAVVISAGLAPYAAWGDGTATTMNPLTFIDRMYRAGAAGAFDVLGFHPYNFPYGPLNPHPASAWNQLQGTEPSVRSLMVQNGDAGKQVWATEFGYPTCTATGEGCVTEEEQATLLGDSLRAWRSYPWAGVMLWYDLVDAGASDTAYNRFGLVRQDFSEKPALAVFRGLSR